MSDLRGIIARLDQFSRVRPDVVPLRNELAALASNAETAFRELALGLQAGAQCVRNLEAQDWSRN